jgi:hypothetical protein
MARAAILLGFFILPAVAQDAPKKPPAEEYRDRLAKIQNSLAEEHFKLGEYLASAAMHRWARDEYRKSVALNPDHEGSRKKLCYVRTAEGWEIDPDAKPEIENKKKGDEATKVKFQYDKKVDQFGKSMAKQWTDLGNFCESNQMKAEAEAAWKKAIEYDPTIADARKKLGYTRVGKDGPWLSKFEAAFRKEAKEGIKKAKAGQPFKEQTQVEKDLGFKNEARQSEHFLIEAPGENQEWLKAAIQHSEHAYAMFHKLFNQKEDLYQQVFNIVVVKDKAAHEAYVDKYNMGDATRREFMKKGGGSIGFPRSETIRGPNPDIHDFAVHVTAQMLSEHLVGGERHWLHEGLAYHFTKTMLGTALCHCTDLAGTGGGGEKNYQNPEDWPLVIRTWVRESKDPSMLEVFKCSHLSELSGAETVKAWSLVDFLVTEHREKFIEYLSKVRGQRMEDDEKTLKEVFGWALEDFDLRWRTYARSSY